MTDEQIRRTIATAIEGDPLLEAMTTLLENAAEAETTAALASIKDAQERAYDCGRAASLRDILSDIDAIRDEKRQAF